LNTKWIKPKHLGGDTFSFGCCLRQYPDGFAACLREVYEEHLRGEARRDLRFKPQMDQHLDEVQQYKNLTVGDLWEDAHLLPVLDYLMNSKLLRTAS